MPRITEECTPGSLDVENASMRPGRNAPDNRADSRRRSGERRASMRPGRNAPDNEPAGFAALNVVETLQ